MKLYIPSIGDEIQLTQAWEFPLYSEHRNIGLFYRLRPGSNLSWGSKASIMVKLEKGTILRVDRIYIRKGKSDWDSVSFYIVQAPNDSKRQPVNKRTSRPWGSSETITEENTKLVEKLKGARFWAKLEDVNTINFSKIE